MPDPESEMAEQYAKRIAELEAELDRLKAGLLEISAAPESVSAITLRLKALVSAQGQGGEEHDNA